MVPTAAELTPVTAPNPAQAPIVVTRRPPGKCPKKRYIAANKSSPIFDWLTTCPMKIKSGMEANKNSLPVLNAVVKNCVAACSSPNKTHSPPNATRAVAHAMWTPMTTRTIRSPKDSMPISVKSMVSILQMGGVGGFVDWIGKTCKCTQRCEHREHGDSHCEWPMRNRNGLTSNAHFVHVLDF